MVQSTGRIEISYLSVIVEKTRCTDKNEEGYPFVIHIVSTSFTLFDIFNSQGKIFLLR